MALVDFLFPSLAKDIREIKAATKTIIMNQKEATDALNAVADELAKVSAESTQLLADIQALKDAAANAPVSPELQAAIDKVAAQAKTVDDLVPDAPTA